jgi:hypothetical protein
VVCLSVIVKPRKMRRPRPPRGCPAIGGKKDPNICVSSVQNVFHVTDLAPRNFGWLLDFRTIRASPALCFLHEPTQWEQAYGIE